MLFLYYLIAINIIGLFIMGIDKKRAKAGLWRISENTIIFTALIGGSIGVYSGLKMFHHKTKHFKFRVMVPVVLLIQVVLIGWLLFPKH